MALMASKAIGDSGGSAEDQEQWFRRAYNSEFAEAAWLLPAESLFRWFRNDSCAMAILEMVSRQQTAGQSVQLGDLMALPKGSLYLMSAIDILVEQYGLARSVDEWAPMDAAGLPIPLYTYSAIDYLSQLDFSQSSVFEYGSGMSTMWWAARCARVVALETDQGWLDQVQTRVSDAKYSHVHLHLLKVGKVFAAGIDQFDDGFDVIVVDAATNRHNCARHARSKLKRGGMIVLDNSEWYPKSAEFLRNSGLLQIDFTGFKSTESHTSVTSVFFERSFALNPVTDRQPSLLPGSLDVVTSWDVWDEA